MAAAHHVQVRGVIRFSYLSEGGFALSSKSDEEIMQTIYDPDRLMRRFQLFERLALHSVKFQRNENFKVAVLTGDTLPDDARAHLKALIKDVPQMQLVSLPKMIMTGALRRAFSALEDDEGATHTATFRLDDDDAMHRITTHRIAKLSHQFLGLRNPRDPFAIGFTRGFYLDTSKRRKPLREWYEKTPLGIGLTLVAPKDMPLNVFRRNHRKLGQYFDSFNEIGKPMYIRSVHRDNDSSAKPTGREGELSREEIAKVLWRGFRLRLEDLRGLHAP